MRAVSPTCPGCHSALPEDPAALAGLKSCPACRRGLEVTVLGNFDREPATGTLPTPASDVGDARCFFHGSRRAELPCDTCGRYLCALCDVPLGGRHLCPECLALDRNQLPAGAEPDRIRWDVLAWWTLLGGFLLCWPSALVLGPAVVVLAMVRSKSPASRVARSRASLLAAAVAGGVLCIAAAALGLLIAGGAVLS